MADPIALSNLLADWANEGGILLLGCRRIRIFLQMNCSASASSRTHNPSILLEWKRLSSAFDRFGHLDAIAG